MNLSYHAFCCCMDCQLSLGLGHGLCIMGCWALAWIVMCCLVCVMDCDLLLDVCDGLCVMVSWLPCCCMACDLLLNVCHGLCIWFLAVLVHGL